MDDFQIKLSATIADFTSLDKQIQSHFDSKRFKINVDANVSGGGISSDGTSKGVATSASSMKKASTQADNLRSRLKVLQTQGALTSKQFTEFNTKLDAIDTSTANAGDAMRIFKNELSEASAITRSHSQDIDKILPKYLKWYLLAGLVSGVQNAFKKVVEEVKRMDAALVELNKVADLTDSEMASIKQQAFDIGTNVGKTATEVLDAATAFKRAGYSIQESMNLAETALIMTNVAEGIKDAGTAAEYLVSILKGAKLPISEATHLLDSLNEISNTQAVSFDNLANMTQRAAGTMNTLGNSIEETMALITGAYEILQDERVAKGISVIGLRLAGLNEDMERQSGLQSKINKALMEYAGISVFDSTMQLRSTFDILQDLAVVWDTLGVNVQAYLTTMIAGKNRADVLSAALSNWDNVEKSLNSALDSTGSALEEQQRYLDSIEGKQEALANAWQKLADDTMSSDFVKRMLDFATGFVNLIDSMGGLVPVVTTLVGLLLTIKSEQIADYISKIAIAFKATTTAVVGTKAAVTSLQAALGWVGLIVAAISVISQIVNGISSSIENARKKEEEARQTAIAAAEQTASKLQSLRDEYSNLASKEVKTAEDEKRLLDIQKTLALSFVDLKDKINDASLSYDDWLKIIDKKTIDQWKLQLAALSKDIEEANKYFNLEAEKSASATFGGISSIMDLRRYLGIRYEGYGQAEKLIKEQSTESLNQILEEASQIQSLRKLSAEESEVYKLVVQELTARNEKSTKYNEILEKQAELEDKIANGVAQIEFNESEYGKQLKATRESISALLSEAEVRVEQMEEESAELKKQKDLQDKLLAVEKARLELAQARNKQIRVFRAGRGFVYESDESEVASAQENLTKALEALSEYKYQQELENAKSFVDQLNKILSTDGDITKGWGDMLTNLGELTDEQFGSIIESMKAKIIEFNEWVSENGGGSIISLGGASVNAYASGTSYARGGLSLVGEGGPELVNLPTGSRVYTASETKNMLGGLRGSGALGSTLVFNGDLSFPNVRNGSDAEGFINGLLQIGNNSKPQFV